MTHNFTIPEEVISDLTEEMEQVRNIEPAGERGQMPEPDPLQTFYGLPNRPLRKDEELLSMGNGALRVVNMAAPPAYVRLYDPDGYERIVPRELVNYALSVRGPDGQPFFTARPVKQPKEPEYKCRYPGCKGMLHTKADRAAHERGYHPSWWEMKERERQMKRERVEEIQKDAMVALVSNIANNVVEVSPDESVEDDEEDELSGVPDATWSRALIIKWLSKNGQWDREFLSLTKEQLLAKAMMYAANPALSELDEEVI